MLRFLLALLAVTFAAAFTPAAAPLKLAHRSAPRAAAVTMMPKFLKDLFREPFPNRAQNHAWSATRPAAIPPARSVSEPITAHLAAQCLVCARPLTRVIARAPLSEHG